MTRTVKIGIPVFVLTAYVMMLTLGAIHSDIRAVPAFGYLTCLGIAATLAFITSQDESLANFEWKRSGGNSRSRSANTRPRGSGRV